jgi:D-xylose transport system substrate-binding protein
VTKAAGVFQQMLTAAGGTIQGVVAANDDIANAAIGVLQQTGLSGHVAITGQDSGVEGLQNIINGKQSMTVFKNVKIEAQAAAALAIALTEGKTPAQAGLTVAPFSDPQSPSHKLQALLLPPQVITQANLKDVTNTGILTVAQVCQGITAACQALGLS